MCLKVGAGATITVDNVMPIATGHEREELQAALTVSILLKSAYFLVFRYYLSQSVVV